MKALFLSLGILACGLLVAGCGESVPVNPKPADGTNPYVQGTPEERIKNIQADTSLSPEERERRIQVVKERNHLK
ncbi:MAG: hypothetical protein JST12_11365 [Armatimonadetes bacterium]|nr:hypothetical protein [Armatimonadota bacterium]MBS1702252.1 hypothetical protein [Armatimonadota bacterium]MBS1727084.1 hypothetical protein [Armatimonadota bacterium]